MQNASTALETAFAGVTVETSGSVPDRLLLVGRTNDRVDKFAGGQYWQISGRRDVLLDSNHHECCTKQPNADEEMATQEEFPAS
jgi:hypothetical protein